VVIVIVETELLPRNLFSALFIIVFKLISCAVREKLTLIKRINSRFFFIELYNLSHDKSTANILIEDTKTQIKRSLKTNEILIKRFTSIFLLSMNSSLIY
jgi:hypothetical protein